ncbi:MAG: sulfur carrier protein ThiS [Acidobacteriota bacterium]|nr:sulfur carrier protein ThiS [Blastocatellia bacterium]MDW8411654.1 sulfur carrier protein ThiS [Acidobacteriota bacterium]
MKIYLNGEQREVKENISIFELLESLNLRLELVAVELNRNIVKRGEWATTVLKDGDTLEVVHFVGGG